MQCISTVSFNILVNSKHSKLIYPGIGIRQGNHISSYIFINNILVDIFILRLLSLILTYELHLIKIVLIFHFSVCWWLYYRATKKAAREIKYILDHCCHVSSLSINYRKSTIQFSVRIDKSVKTDIANILQVQNTGSIGSYLDCYSIDM